MQTSPVRVLVTSLFTAALGIAHTFAAQFTTDFNSFGVPPGSVVAGTAFIDTSGGVGNSGVLKITSAAGGQQGTYFIPDFAGGNAVTNFKAIYRIAIGGGTARPADGMSFNFATDLPAPPGTFGEDGAGTGLIVSFDTWDNAGADTAPAIEARFGGALIDCRTTATNYLGTALRDANRDIDPLCPFLTNSVGDVVSLETFGPGPATPNDGSFVDVVIELFPDNTLSVSFSNVVVFDHLATTYSPISGGTFALAGRTGGATETHWVDNLQVFANFTAGPATITTQPTDQTVTETKSATFSVGLDGTPPFTIRWFSNNVVIAGATQPTYTTPPTTVAMNGTLYHAEVSNADNPTPVVSGNARLTVTPGVVLSSASTRGQTNKVFVTFSKPVQLNGTYTLNNGATVGSRAYGASHSEVVLTTGLLNAGTTYTLTVAGVTGEDNSPMVPDPAMLNFAQGFGAFCHDFDDNVLPDGTLLSGMAALPGDGIIHLTDPVNGACGEYFIPDQLSGAPLATLLARWSSRVGGGTGGGADGYSFNWGVDVVTGCSGSEEGAGSGLSVSVDTFDNGCNDCATGTDTGLEIKWRGNRVAYMHTTKAFLRKDEFVDAEVSVTPSGLATFTYDSLVLTALLPGYSNGIAGGNFSFVARTGGANDNQWIDNICINDFTLGPLFFTLEPVDTSVLVGDSAAFTAKVDGSPPFRFQWFTNGIAATSVLLSADNSSSYTISSTTAALEGLKIHVTASNDFSAVTSSNATLHVQIIPQVVSVSSCATSEVHVVFSTDVDLNPGTYMLSGGFESFRAYGTSHREVVITFDTPLVVNNSYTLTVTDVRAQGGGSMLAPNPTMFDFRHGFATFTADFNNNMLPTGTTVDGAAVVGGPSGTDGILHLTDAGQAGTNGGFFIPDQNSGLPLDRLLVRWRMQIGGGQGGGADGASLSWSPDVPLTSAGPFLGGQGAEGGAGTGLAVTIDTFDNGTGVTPTDVVGIEIMWQGARVASASIPKDDPGTGVFLRKNQFVDAELAVTPGGVATFNYDGTIISATLPGFTAISNANFLFAARTGGANDNHWVDDLRINSFALTAPVILSGPNYVATNECTPMTFRVQVDGYFPYGFQWLRDGTPIPGATSSVFTKVADRSDNGHAFSVIVSNQCGMVTSRVAMATITLSTTPCGVLTIRRGDCAGANDPNVRPGDVCLQWNGPFRVQSTDELHTNPADNVWVDVPGTSPLTQPAPAGPRFYRLIFP